MHGARSDTGPSESAPAGDFFYLEFEDLFLVIGLAACMSIFGRFLHREIHGIPLNVILQYACANRGAADSMLFKYGKPRGYIRDLLTWLVRPRIYCGLETDTEFTREFLQ
jgi:hypothetical protein